MDNTHHWCTSCDTADCTGVLVYQDFCHNQLLGDRLTLTAASMVVVVCRGWDTERLQMKRRKISLLSRVYVLEDHAYVKVPYHIAGSTWETFPFETANANTKRAREVTQSESKVPPRSGAQDISLHTVTQWHNGILHQLKARYIRVARHTSCYNISRSPRYILYV